MNDRIETLINGRRERLQRLLLRPLDTPSALDGSPPIPDAVRQHLMEYADDLYWNELEWENITEEEVTGNGAVPQLIFPGFLAFVRGLLLEEALPEAKGTAEPRPELVADILRFLARRVVELEEALAAEQPEEPGKLEDELDATDHLLDLVLYLYHDLSEAEVERMEEHRTGAATGD